MFVLYLNVGGISYYAFHRGDEGYGLTPDPSKAIKFATESSARGYTSNYGRTELSTWKVRKTG